MSNTTTAPRPTGAKGSPEAGQSAEPSAVKADTGFGNEEFYNNIIDGQVDLSNLTQKEAIKTIAGLVDILNNVMQEHSTDISELQSEIAALKTKKSKKSGDKDPFYKKGWVRATAFIGAVALASVLTFNALVDRNNNDEERDAALNNGDQTEQVVSGHDSWLSPVLAEQADREAALAQAQAETRTWLEMRDAHRAGEISDVEFTYYDELVGGHKFGAPLEGDTPAEDNESLIETLNDPMRLSTLELGAFNPDYSVANHNAFEAGRQVREIQLRDNPELHQEAIDRMTQWLNENLDGDDVISGQHVASLYVNDNPNTPAHDVYDMIKARTKLEVLSYNDGRLLVLRECGGQLVEVLEITVPVQAAGQTVVEVQEPVTPSNPTPEQPTPEEPNTPNTPEEPETPETPEEPNTPNTPEEPENPNLPEEEEEKDELDQEDAMDSAASDVGEEDVTNAGIDHEAAVGTVGDQDGNDAAIAAGGDELAPENADGGATTTVEDSAGLGGATGQTTDETTGSTQDNSDFDPEADQGGNNGGVVDSEETNQDSAEIVNDDGTTTAADDEQANDSSGAGSTDLPG